MTITDIAKEEAEIYVSTIHCESEFLERCRRAVATKAFEVAYMLGYNRGRAEEMSKGDYE